MRYKKGQILYSVSVGDDGKCELDTYKVSTVNKNGSYAILVASFTWINKAAAGKRFSKTNNWGWAKDIPSWCRYTARPGEAFSSLVTTPLAAWRAAEKNLLRCVDEDAIPRATKAIKAAISRLGK